MASVRTESHGQHLVYVLEDANAGSSARVLPGYGFNCYSFQCRVGERPYELLSAADHFADAPSHASGNGIPILFPFPNRIAGGRFEFAGKVYELPQNHGPNAIHGLVIDRPWRIVPNPCSAAAEITGELELTRDLPELASLWPADFRIQLRYTLEENRLTSRFRVTNPDSRPLPWGFGTHPYFRLPLAANGNEAHASVRVPATQFWELEASLPTGAKRPVSGVLDLRRARALSELKLDHVLTGLEFSDGWCPCRLLDHDAGVEVVYRFDTAFRDVVLYTPPRRGSVCVEPYTCVTDAVNLHARGIDAGLAVLEAGASAEGTMVLEATGLNEPARG